MTILGKLNMTALNVEAGGLLYRGLTMQDLLKAEVPTATIFEAVKDWLKSEVDVAAEDIRSAVLTPGAGQAMEYQEAQTQAFAATSSPASATADKFPMLAASIGIDVDPETGKPATDVLGVARSVIVRYSAWNMVGAGIRGARLRGKAAIDATADVTGAVSAFDAIAWPAIPGA